MTLIINPDYHALPILEKNGIRWIPHSQAKRQDIRPLRIGILNIMPLGEKYEFNILHPLGLSVLQLEPIWIRLESHNYKTWESKHLNEIYVTYEKANIGWKGDVNKYVYDLKKIKNNDWSPKYSSKQAIKKTLNDYFK